MKHILKHTLILALAMALCSGHYLKAQEISQHKKYWYYKTRLNNDFLKVGTGDGESMPFNQRGFSFPPYTNPSDVLKAGDGTTQLGIYIAVLATEYRLLKNNGQDVTKVKHELFCALNAINRLDYYAESVIGNSPHPQNPHTTSSPNLNGFFLRDDIHEDFVKNNYEHFNYYNSGLTNAIPNNKPGDKGFTQLNTGGQYTVNSSYQSFNDPNNISNLQWNSPSVSTPGLLQGTEESQDQMYYLLMGTALASKLVDNYETDGSNIFGYGSGQGNLVTEAINISDRLISHVKSDPLWNIRDPANGNAFVQVGSNAAIYAYALDNGGCFIKYGQDLPSYALLSPLVQNPCNDFRNLVSATPIAWNGLVALNGGPSVDEQGFYHSLAAICNCILEDRNYLNLTIQAAINAAQAQINNVISNMNSQIQNLQNQINNLPNWAQNLLNGLLAGISAAINYASTAIAGLNYLINQLTTQLLAPIKINTSEDRLLYNNYANLVNYNGCSGPLMNSNFGSKEYFGIFLWHVLHPAPASIPNWIQLLTGNLSPVGYAVAKQDLNNILDQAPCEGNYNFYPTRPGSEWGNPNRLDRMDPTYRYNTSCPTGFLGEYHGLDYMLLHNLYYLAVGTGTPVIDFSERNVTANMPIGSNFITGNKNTLGGYEFITASNTINSNGAAYYRAGKEIALLPSFSAVQGSDFDANINPYNCANNNNQYNGEMLRSSSSPGDDYDGPVSSSNTSKTAKAKNTSSTDDRPSADNFKRALDSLIKKPDFNLQPIASKILVYPNPNNGIFNIAFRLSNEDNVNFDIYDNMGNSIYSEKHVTGSFVMPIDLGNLSKGIYLAKFNNAKGEQIIHKITIN